MPTLIELEGLCACAELCAALGLQFVEVNLNMPMYQLEHLYAAEMRKIQDTYGIGFTFHLDENMDVSDFNTRVRKAHVDTVLGAIHLAQEIGAPVINMHMPRGVYFSLPEDIIYLYERYHEAYTASLGTFRETCVQAIGGCPIQISIENTNGFLPFQQWGVELLLESAAFGLTLDVGHDHGVQHIDMPFYNTYADRVHHMHLHDVLGKRAHLALGSGDIDVKKWLHHARSHHMRVVFETKTIDGLKRSAQYALGMEGEKC